VFSNVEFQQIPKQGKHINIDDKHCCSHNYKHRQMKLDELIEIMYCTDDIGGYGNRKLYKN